MHDFKTTLEWYETHNTTEEIGFDPDNQCLRVCRTARDIEMRFGTAKECQDAVPKKNRFYKVKDWRRGMNLFVDDPNDSNEAGHIVTIIGRVRGFKDWNDPHEVLVETNSVIAGRLVVVRATYFTEHWGDKIQFAANWLNGEVLDYPLPPTETDPAGPSRVENFKASRPEWDVKILDRAISGGRRDLTTKVQAIDAAVEKLPTDDTDTRVKDFKEHYAKRRELKLRLLNEAVAAGRTGEVKSVRDELRQIIKSLPDR